jgi:hypothetical protein
VPGGSVTIAATPFRTRRKTRDSQNESLMNTNKIRIATRKSLLLA